MSAVSSHVGKMLKGDSGIRAMFEEGLRMKAERGADNVFDFSLGNPDLPAPEVFEKALSEVVQERAMHTYMPNPGFPDTRKKAARLVSALQNTEVPFNNVIMTVGAASALNVSMKAILDPEDEVIILAPFFPEYRHYAMNHGGKYVIVETDNEFQPDAAKIKAAITPKTRAVIINSPNNPTGIVFSAESMKSMIAVIKEANDVRVKKEERPIFLVADTVYQNVSYDAHVEPVFPHYENTIIATSMSKDLSLAGERIGYLAVNPACKFSQELIGGLIFSLRTMGFVNAPALMQRTLARIPDDTSVDISKYRERRDVLLKYLDEAGIKVVKPEGAFFVFPFVPEGVEDKVFIDALKEKGVLVVPGSIFGRGGCFRMSYGVPMKSIHGAGPIFKEVVENLRK